MARRVGRDSDMARRYSPLASVLVAVLIALFVLPSALNIPQSNPTQTLEFAPIPPEDDQPPPPDTGNLSELALGSSAPPVASAGGDGPGTAAPLPPLPLGVGERPVTKRCVGSPPRQTEDPMAPPCVAHYEGTNDGPTHRGVDENEVRIVFYVDAGRRLQNEYGRGHDDETQHRGKCFDIGLPEDPEETFNVRAIRRFQTHFNLRYQTYGRVVHFWVCMSSVSGSSGTPEMRRADAAKHLDEIDPFAVMTSGLLYGDLGPYVEAVVDQGVLAFGTGVGLRSQDFYERGRGLAWGFEPTIERRARFFSGYVCDRVVPHPVVDSDIDGANGGPRTYGFLSTTDRETPELMRFADMVRPQLEACGVEFAEEGTFPTATVTNRVDAHDPANSYAAENMARFQGAGVTTIIWAGGLETEMSEAADTIDYFPEWIVAGDGLHEAYNQAHAQADDVWEHAWVLTPRVRLWPDNDDPCRKANREADQEVGDGDQSLVCSGSTYFADVRQLFTAIQAAGPRLTPETVEQGFRAIPTTASVDPFTPACFYEPGDFTCVKDAMAMYWDEAASVGGETGCWRLPEEGHRFLENGWYEGNIDGQATGTDPCHVYYTDVELYGS